jgi:hypothetical protein
MPMLCFCCMCICIYVYMCICICGYVYIHRDSATEDGGVKTPVLPAKNAYMREKRTKKWGRESPNSRQIFTHLGAFSRQKTSQLTDFCSPTFFDTESLRPYAHTMCID